MLVVEMLLLWMQNSFYILLFFMQMQLWGGMGNDACNGNEISSFNKSNGDSGSNEDGRKTNS